MSHSKSASAGLDVHATSIRIAAVRDDELLCEKTLPYDLRLIERELRRWPDVHACYEAGPTGFGLYRHLTAAGIRCSVVAPGLVPQRSGDRVKTDPRDARKLARLLQGGLLEPIYVPTEELEAARDLVRAREDARLDRMRDRNRMSKFLLRHELRAPSKSWSRERHIWLAGLQFERPAQQQAFATYLQALDLVDARIAALEREIAAVAADGPWRELVGRLRCLRGIDTLSALGIVCEVGDFDRFGSAEEFMAFTGLVPSEHSSGETRKRGAITKTGNTHVRRLLVEAAWNADHRPMVGATLARRQAGQDALVIERAWRCQHRLHRRWRRMQGRGKPRQKIVVAVARELSGFVWAIATEQPLRTS